MKLNVKPNLLAMMILGASLNVQAMPASTPETASCEAEMQDSDISDSLDDFQDSMTDIGESGTGETGSTAVVGEDFSEVADIAPSLEADANKAVDVFGPFIGAEMGLLSLINGIKDGNVEQEAIGGVTLGTSVAIPIATRIISEVAGEMAGEIFGGAAAVVVVEGFNIYSAVKDEQMFSKIRKADENLNQQYISYVNKLKNHMSTTKAALSGNGAAALKIDVENMPTILFEINKEKITTMANTLIARAMEANAGVVGQQSYSTSLNNSTSANSIVKRSIEGIQGVDAEDTRTQLTALGNTLNEQFIETHPNTLTDDPAANAMSRNYLYNEDIAGSFSPVVGVYQSYYFNHYFAPMLHFQSNVAGPSAKIVIDSIMENNKATLVTEFKQALRNNLNGSQWQQSLRENYNTIIRERMAWFFFGESLVQDADTESFNELEASLYLSRIFLPFFVGFYDATLAKEAADQLQLAPVTSALVNTLISQKIDITDDTAVTAAINAKVAGSTDVPDNLAESIQSAIAVAKTKIQPLLIQANQVQPIRFNSTEVSRTVDRLEADNYFVTSVDQAISQFIDSFRAQNLAEMHDGSQAIRTFIYGLMRDSSELHSVYMAGIKRFLDTASRDFYKDSRSCDAIGGKMIKLANDIENFYYSYSAQDPEFENYPWMTFNSVPEIEQTTNMITSQIRQNAVEYFNAHTCRLPK